ncbi:U1 small nuclear ribonucleoprotein 70 kDa homolog [Monosporozyma servazzii]
MSKFPTDVTRLFQPGPPLKHLKQVDYPIYERQTNPNIAGLSSYLTHLSDYQKKFPHGSRNQYLNIQSKIITKQDKHQRKLTENYKHWNPHNDPHMKNTDPFCTIFVGRLPYDVDELELQNHFSRFGDIEKVRIVREKEPSIDPTQNKNKKKKKKGKVAKVSASPREKVGNVKAKPRGYGFIVFSDPMSSKKCIRETGVHRGIEIHGRKCIVDYERGRTNKYFVPTRFGGGLGNRGYSTMMNEHVPSEDNRHRGPSRFQSSQPQQHRHTGPHEGHYTKPRYSSQGDYYPPPMTHHEQEPVQEEQHTVSYRSRVSRTHASTSKDNQSSLDY